MPHRHVPGAFDAHGQFRSEAPFDWRRLAQEQADRLPLANQWWDLLGRPAGKRVADVGCGPGVLSAHYAALGAEVLAVDLRADALAQVPRHPRIRTLVHDLEAAPLPEHVDAIILSDVLHHARQPEAMLRFSRASADWILVADHDVVGHQGPPAASRLSPERVSQFLRLAGFAPKPVVRPVPGQYAIVADKA